MRIGIDVRLGGGQNGIARYIADFVGALAALDDRDEFVLFGSSSEPPFETSLPYVALTSNFVVYYGISLPNAIRTRRIQALLAPSIFCPPFAGCRTVTVLYDTYTFKLHEWLSSKDLRSPQARVQRFKADLRLLSLRSTDSILCISESTLDDLASIPKLLERASVVYPDASAKFCQTRETVERTDTILYVGAFNRQKAVDTLIAAHAAYVSRFGLSTRLQLAGKPTWPEFDLEKTIAAHGYAHLVDVIANPSDARLLELYRTCGLFAYLSHYEGFGLPVLEAIRCGAPALVSDRSSLREIVPFAEYRADPTSVEDIVSKIVEIRRRPEAVARREFEHARTFSWVASADAARRLLAGDAIGAG